MKIETDDLTMKGWLWLGFLKLAEKVEAWVTQVQPEEPVVLEDNVVGHVDADEIPLKGESDEAMPCIYCSHPEGKHYLDGWVKQDQSLAVMVCGHEGCNCKYMIRERAA